MKRLTITLEYPPTQGGIASYVYNFFLTTDSSENILYAPIAKGDTVFDSAHPWKVFRSKPYTPFLWPHWLRLFWQVRSLVKKEKVTELYIHHALPVGYVGFLIKKLFKIPYTLFLHGTDVSLVARKPFKRNNFRFVARHAKQLVVNSIFLQNKVLERFGDGLPPIKIVYPCPGEQFLQPLASEELHAHRQQLALNGKKVLLSVGRLADGKGHMHLLRALQLILLEVPNTVLLLVGSGSKQKVLLDFIQKNNLQNAVRFFGAQPYEKLPLYYQLADVFVLLTHPELDAEEGWGTVFLEAAASGLPVVAGSAGGSSEAVVNLETGVVVDATQEKVVVKSIVELLKNQTFAKEMGQRGRERVLSEFTWKKQLAELLEK
jgi:phosphatidylinositol alpha-1,6-mannosyltransferase